MADVTVYKRCLADYWWAGQVFHAGEIRVGTDAGVTANPQYWVALTDTDLTTGKTRVH